MTEVRASDCYSCRQNAVPEVERPPREHISDDGSWRVVHAIGCSLPGWLCLIPHRHISSLSEMTQEEASLLGPLIRRLSAVLQRLTGARKCYLMFFAEAPGFEHLHIHLVPRPPDCPEDRVGPRIVAYLNDPEELWIAAEEMDAMALRVREELVAGA